MPGTVASGAGIDRRALVGRHDVQVLGVVPESPLSVGNGEFCFTVDVTGLQTWPERYPVAPRTGDDPGGSLLGTLSQWGWHSFPGSYELDETRRTYSTPRGPVPYVDLGGEMDLGTTSEPGQTPAEEWLRANPHRLELGQIGFVLPGEVVDARQRLDLWGGVVDSSFVVDGHAVRVRTVCAPEDDVVAVRVETMARLGVRFAFPYGSGAWSNGADWDRPGEHTTTVDEVAGGWQFERRLDGTRYWVTVGAEDARLEQIGTHEFLLRATAEVLELRVQFSGERREVPRGFEEIEADCRQSWERFWESGAAVSLDGDARAVEVERRVVLSQYLTAINCAGSLPPQETGLVCNSWRGRFHLEMHWWHGAHFALWGRGELLVRSLGWYERILPVARETARLQGYDGVRWPKQVAPDGRESPSSIGPFLVWQQPHPIYLAELIRRTGSADAVERYGQLVLESAEFMASYAVKTARGYQLGPPLIPAQESYSAIRGELVNPTFELAYWRWALIVAQEWRAQLGLPPEPRWAEVADGLVPAPVRDGCYAAIDGEPWTVRGDHPSMLYALGLVPDTSYVDQDVMRRTLSGVLADWDWESTWGWDYPAIAMTAARLGEPELAVEALLLKATKNDFLPNGHNRQTPSLPVYLPGNGGLLAAVALMAAGADGVAPAFPRDWTVRHEGLHRSP
ncbi:hypothetical protein [Kribbella endophytica]